MALNPTLALHLQGWVAKEPSHGRTYILVASCWGQLILPSASQNRLLGILN